MVFSVTTFPIVSIRVAETDAATLTQETAIFMLSLHPVGSAAVQREEGKWEATSRNAFPRILGKVEKADVLVGEKMYCRKRKKPKSKFRGK